MLACARIGAVHSIIFGGFSPDSISGRINDCKSDYVITADEGLRGGKTIPLKSITDDLLKANIQNSAVQAEMLVRMNDLAAASRVRATMEKQYTELQNRSQLAYGAAMKAEEELRKAKETGSAEEIAAAEKRLAKEVQLRDGIQEELKLLGKRLENLKEQTKE